jgi:rubredoxin
VLDRPLRQDQKGGMRVKCEQCGWVVNPDPPYIFHSKTFAMRAESGAETTRTLWLCPDCSAEFASNRARDRFLKQRFDAAVPR